MSPVVAAPATRREVTIYIGGVHASREPTVVKTLLGSCIAACLWDPGSEVGGMNHFMLPTGSDATDDRARFGVHAMDLLIGAIMKAGGDRRRLRAKVFGGAHVLAMADGKDSVPRRNLKFIIDFVRDEGFELVAKDIGGHQPRQVLFDTATGRAWVKRLRSNRTFDSVLAQERTAPPPPAYGEMTLF